jgi:hypothetical protein
MRLPSALSIDVRAGLAFFLRGPDTLLPLRTRRARARELVDGEALSAVRSVVSSDSDNPRAFALCVLRSASVSPGWPLTLLR